jgi:hypothetical protein
MAKEVIFKFDSEEDLDNFLADNEIQHSIEDYAQDQGQEVDWEYDAHPSTGRKVIKISKSYDTEGILSTSSDFE